MTDAIFDSSYLVSNETQHSSERRIDINGTTLAFSPEAQQQMHELDELIINLETAAEIVGFGLANSDKTDEVRITEFVAPKPENIFNLNTFMINQDEKKLAQILADATSLQLTLLENEVALIPNDSIVSEEWMHFPIKQDTGEINWSFAYRNLPDLFGFNPPKTRAELEQLMMEISNTANIENDSDYLHISVKSDWDLVISSMSVWITGGFIARTIQRAEDTNTEITFSMHHHPTLGRFKDIADESSRLYVEEMYTTLLQYSPDDVAFMHQLQASFFEIRAFGSPDHPFDRGSGYTTSKFYNVPDILDNDEKTRKYVFGE